MPTNDFTVTFWDCCASQPACSVTVLNVPEPKAYAEQSGMPLSWLPDQEAVARVIGMDLVRPQDTPTYGVHAQRVYR